MHFPDQLLADIYWSLSEPVPTTPLDLLEAAQRYASDVGVPDPSSQLTTPLPFADLVVRCSFDVRNEAGEWTKTSKQHRIVGPIGQLTAADVLWELHVAFAQDVGRSDKHFFEGLELVEVGKTPVYELVLGS